MQGTLVGLLAAFSYELSILHAAARLTHADAFRTLHTLYRERTHPLPAPIGVPSSDGVLFHLLFLQHTHPLQAPLAMTSIIDLLFNLLFLKQAWARFVCQVSVKTRQAVSLWILCDLSAQCCP